MRSVALFILSDVRSGSTLLDQCLGAHPEMVSLGEVHWLPAYILRDRKTYNPAHPLVCMCGKPVRECPFWTAVATSLGRPLETLKLRTKYSLSSDSGSSRRSIRLVPRRILRIVPASFRLKPVREFFGGPAMARDSVDLFNAVSVATDCRICVDSSKSAFRFRAVYELEPQNTRAVVLVRDYRAVVHSKMRHGMPLETAARGWRNKMRQIEALTRDLPASRVHVLKYESLCEDPGSELSKLCSFLGVGFSDAMLKRSTQGSHHIGGSPSKFDETRTRIVLDRSYENKFGSDDLQRIRRLTSSAVDRWGY